MLDTWKMPHERITMDEARRGNGVSRHGNQTGEGEREGDSEIETERISKGKVPTSCVDHQYTRLLDYACHCDFD